MAERVLSPASVHNALVVVLCRSMCVETWPLDIVYDIDSNDLLVGFNSNWQIFAQANGTDKLDPRLIVQKPIWDFIINDETRHLHQVLVQRVRSGKQPLNMAFRCDSPTLRRYMLMSMKAHDGLVRYRCELVRTEARAEVPFIGSNPTRSESFLRMCSWCKKIEVRPQCWQEIEDAVTTLELFSSTDLPQISHTICEPCDEALYGDD